MIHAFICFLKPGGKHSCEKTDQGTRAKSAFLEDIFSDLVGKNGRHIPQPFARDTALGMTVICRNNEVT